jgi:hypothetical protein
MKLSRDFNEFLSCLAADGVRDLADLEDLEKLG